MATETPIRVSISILLKHLCGKILLFEPACDIDDLRSLLLRIRGRPTFPDVSCARLASATAPDSRSGTQSWCHVDIGIEMAVGSLVASGRSLSPN